MEIELDWQLVHITPWMIQTGARNNGVCVCQGFDFTSCTSAKISSAAFSHKLLANVPRACVQSRPVRFWSELEEALLPLRVAYYRRLSAPAALNLITIIVALAKKEQGKLKSKKKRWCVIIHFNKQQVRFCDCGSNSGLMMHVQTCPSKHGSPKTHLLFMAWVKTKDESFYHY